MRTDLFASPLFVLSVALLLANDWILKAAFHNWLTGKLSDFAGLVAVTVFACALAPKRRALLATLISAAFAYWKSPYSQGLIDAANVVLPFSIGRTVDYSDLMALPAAWVAAGLALRMRGWSTRAWVRHGFVTVGLIAFTGTSSIPQYGERKIADFATLAPPSTAELQAVLDAVAARHDLTCDICDSLIDGRRYAESSSILMLVASVDAARLWSDVSALSRTSTLV
jgi:hypothetical protein